MQYFPYLLVFIGVLIIFAAIAMLKRKKHTKIDDEDYEEWMELIKKATMLLTLAGGFLIAAAFIIFMLYL